VKVSAAARAAKSISSGADAIAGGGKAIEAASRALEVEGRALETAQGALARLQATHIDAGIADAETNVSVVISGLMAVQARAALERVRELDAELGPLLIFLRFVREPERVPRLPPGEVARELVMQKALDAPLADVRAELNEYFATRFGADAQSAAMRVWAQFRDELRSNPDVPLPSLPSSS
jgi:hypothetical protein